MSKLVLFLPDDSTLDIPLDRERLTIGRRAGNDVVLPNLAVSGEHAVVVTILADSFLEDLNSTNGTLVNEEPVAKHFLRDRDEIDIGRHKLVYCTDDDATFKPKNLKGAARVMERDFGGKVETAKPFVRRSEEKSTAEPAPEGAEAAASAPSPSRAKRVASRGATTSRPVAQPVEALLEPPASVQEEAPAPQPVEEAPIVGPAVRLLNGVRAGKMIALTKAETTVGRPGIQVATIVRNDKGFRIKPLEGISPPSVNGRPVDGDGADLAPGDVIELVATRLEFVDPTSAASR
jgi:pSer/pThr/pTyr-binding forkhead associated (FHA) protein